MTGAPATSVELEQSSQSEEQLEQHQHQQEPFDESPTPSLQYDHLQEDLQEGVQGSL